MNIVFADASVAVVKHVFHTNFGIPRKSTNPQQRQLAHRRNNMAEPTVP